MVLQIMIPTEEERKKVEVIFKQIAFSKDLSLFDYHTKISSKVDQLKTAHGEVIASGVMNQYLLMELETLLAFCFGSSAKEFAAQLAMNLHNHIQHCVDDRCPLRKET
jgi:hypothetical protein